MYQENVALKSRSNDTAWKISMTVQRIVISNTLYKINELEEAINLAMIRLENNWTSGIKKIQKHFMDISTRNRK